MNTPVNITYSSDTEKFPHSTFQFRLTYLDKDVNRVCWFESLDHLTKHIIRYNIKKYEATTNFMETVAKSTRRKGKRV